MRIPELCGAEGRALELEHNAAVRRARDIDNANEAAWKAENETRLAEGQPLITPSKLPTEQIKVKYAFVKELQRIFGERIIRRTIDSVQNDGSSIAALITKETYCYYINP